MAELTGRCLCGAVRWLDQIDNLPKCEGFDAAPVNSGDKTE